MNQVFDLDPTQFNRHDRAIEARFIKEQLRNNETPKIALQPERLTTDFAHVTDAANFLLTLWECPPNFRAFIDALIGIAGYRAGKNEWFKASDKEIRHRANRCTKWVQIQRRDFMNWQNQNNVALIDIEDNRYQNGEKIPHRYRVHIARLSVETLLDARVSLNWKKYRFNDAMLEAAKMMRDSLPETPIHVKHKRANRSDPEATMVQNLKFALTKLRKAYQTNEMTGNNIALTDEMMDAMDQIKIVLTDIEKAQPKKVSL